MSGARAKFNNNPQIEQAFNSINGQVNDKKLAQASELYKNGDFEEAIKIYSTITPMNEDVMLTIATCWQNLGNNEKAITLIALIITVIILVILAAVSIRTVYNMGIVGHAINGTAEYVEAAKNENKMMSDTASYIEEVLGKIKGTKGNDDEAPDLLKDYVLGVEVNGVRPGKSFYDDLYDYDGGTFIPDASSITDASTSVIYLNEMWGDYNQGATPALTGSIYIRYNNVAYKIVCEDDSSTDMRITADVVKVYEPNGREGEIVGYKATTSSETTNWLVLYDNGDTVDITPINPDASWKYTLGSGDPNATGSTALEKAMNSYENAVSRLNNYCKTIVTNVTSADNVRSIGTQFNQTDTTAKYSSTFLENNPTGSEGTYNEVGLVGDMNGEQDVVRMSYYSSGGTGSGYEKYGYAQTGLCYWLASRYVYEYSSSVDFYVRGVGGGIAGGSGSLWGVNSDYAYGDYSTCGVRPVARVAKSALLAPSSTEETPVSPDVN